jgi:putative chitinase
MANTETQMNCCVLAMAGGITSRRELAVFMGQIQEETHFTQAKEEMGRCTAKNVLDISGPHKDKHGVVHAGRVKDMTDARELVKAGPNALAERVYGDRMGNTEPGDALKYTGRGFIQLTGKTNYEHYGKLTGLDLVNHPELANDKANAAKIAVAYWNESVRQNSKPQEDVAAATRRVNGGLKDLKDRETATKEWENKFKQEYTANVTYGAGLSF